MGKKRPIYYDTETTGVSFDEDRIIEIAAYDPVQDRTFEALINPKKPIPADATKIHNITDDMVKDAPSFKEVGLKFSEFCSDNAVLIAHNNDGFDKPMLSAEFTREKLTLPDWHYIDTLKWARKYRPDLPRHSLQHLRKTYGFPENNAHRALDDVITLHRVFSVMIDDLPIETVLALLAQGNKLRTMPFGKHKGQLLKDVPKSYVKWLSESGAFEREDNEELKKEFEKIGHLTPQ